MATVVIIFLLVAILYEFVIFNHYQVKMHEHSGQESTNVSAPVLQPDETDIVGKSTFNMKAEMERKRKQKEEAERKDAIARGEMTEDGKEMAQEGKPEDCEIEQKKVWKQVPSEQLDALFDEPEYEDEPQATGHTIDDIDLAFTNAGRKDMSEDEERQTVEVLKGLEGTELFDVIIEKFPNIGDRINDLFDKYESKPEVDALEKVEVEKESPKAFIIPERFEDFNIRDFV